MEGLQREFPETECTVKYRADILNSSLNTWITMEIKIGRQYHGCPEKCLLITDTILNQSRTVYFKNSKDRHRKGQEVLKMER